MAITFPITGVSAAYTTATRSPSFTLGTSPIENDIIVVVVSSITTSATTDVSGWTNVRGANTVTMPSDSVSAQVMVYHRVTAGEDAANTVTWTLTNLWDATETGRISAIVLRGVALTGELAGTNSVSNAGNTTTPWVIPAVTPTANGVAIAGVIGDGTATAGAVSGWTIRASGNATQTNYIFSLNSAVTNGVATTQTSTTPSTGDEYVTIIAVFKEYVAPTVYERTASLDGTSTLSADGEKESPSFVESAWGTANATLSAIYERTGSISGVSTLTADGEKETAVPTHERTGSITGVSTLTADGLRIAERTGSISGASTLSADGEKETPGLESAWGTANATLSAIYERTGSISGVSTLTAQGLVVSPILKRWNGSEWVAAVVKHGSGWPVVQMNNL